MIEESRIVCPSCGAPLPQSTQPEDTGLCAACAASGDTPNPEGFQDTIASDAFDEKRQVEQTMSIGSGGLGGSGAPGSVRAGSKRLANAPEKIGRFEVKSVLGSGGFGTVYKAHDTLLDREVALKVPRWDDGNKFDNLFLHEAKAAARLRHPNIVAVFECGFVGEQPYIASEYVDGTPLSEILSVGRVQLRQAVQIVQQVAEAIDYAHSEGIVHRDLKPANIMMGKGARPQVMDFGLARLGSDADASIMTEGSIVGTPTFMAPEQARGEKDKVGPKSDQYSVGVLLYLMLCGKTPYRGETWSIVSRVADPVVVPDAPRKIRGTIPRDLEACCLKAMEKDPNRRYDSLADLANDLNNWLEGRPLLARPIGIRERLLRWGAKNRLIASLLAVITGLIFAALIVGYVLAYKFSNLAEYATERANAEEVAKQEVQRVLIDTFTESGLDAGNSGRNQEAVLWFGTAAARASEHRNRQPMALRERMNRIRFQNWLVDTPVPVRMFRGLGHWHETLVVHPTGQYLMSEEHAPDGQQCRIWHLATGEIWKTPWDAAIFAAAWNAQGTSLALASGNEIRTFRFPDGEEVERWQHDTAVYYLKYSPDGNRIAFGGEQRAGVRNLNDEKAVKSIPLPAAVVSFSWNPSGSKLAIHTRDHLVRVFSGDPNVIDEKSLIDPVSSPFNSTPPRVDFVDEDLLVVPESEQAVRCWNLVTGEQIWEVPC